MPVQSPRKQTKSSKMKAPYYNERKKKRWAMEVVRIGEHKMKIVLDKSECAKYGVCINEEYKDTATVRRSLWALLEEAKKHSGLDASGDKLLIQFYPIKGRGCEIFVTRLGILTESSRGLVTSSERVTVISRTRACYAILEADSFEKLKEAVAIITENAPPNADLYRSDSGELYIAVDELGRGDGTPELSPLSEFAHRLPRDFEKYAEEHFELLIKDGALKSESKVDIK